MPKAKPNKFTGHQITMLQRRGLDPKNYVLLKNTYSSLYLRDLRDGSLKIIQKMN